VVRPEEALGTRWTRTWSIAAAYAAFDKGTSFPIVDVTLRGGGMSGPGTAARVEAGVRVMIPLASALAMGSGGTLGVFVPTGGETHGARPLFSAAGSAIFTVVRHFQIELDMLSLTYVPPVRDGEGTLFFVGGEARAMVRF
jgi:hypothetical protein